RAFLDGYNAVQPVRFEPDGTITALNDEPYSSGVAKGINDLGHVVGYLGHDAYLWDEKGATKIGDGDPYFSVIANKINNAGEIVGLSTQGGRAHALFWDVRGVQHRLEDLIPPSGG